MCTCLLTLIGLIVGSCSLVVCMSSHRNPQLYLTPLPKHFDVGNSLTHQRSATPEIGLLYIIPYNCLHWGEYCKKKTRKKTKQNKTVLSALLDNRLYTETQCTTWVWAYTRNGVERKFRAGYGEICESVGAGSVCKIHIRPIDSRSDLPISNTEYLQHNACVH